MTTQTIGRPRDLLGAEILCPHCNQMLTVMHTFPTFSWMAGVDDTGKDNEYCVVTLSDGASARFWRKE
jgi:hypothetical protein